MQKLQQSNSQDYVIYDSYIAKNHNKPTITEGFEVIDSDDETCDSDEYQILPKTPKNKSLGLFTVAALHNKPDQVPEVNTNSYSNLTQFFKSDKLGTMSTQNNGATNSTPTNLGLFITVAPHNKPDQAPDTDTNSHPNFKQFFTPDKLDTASMQNYGATKSKSIKSIHFKLPREIYKHVIKLFGKKDYDAALQEVNYGLYLHPNVDRFFYFQTVLQNLVKINNSLEKPLNQHKSIIALISALDSFIRANEFMVTDNNHAAIQEYDRVNSFTQKHFIPLYFQACCYQRIGRYTKARIILNEAIKLQPDFSPLFAQRARIYFALEHNEAAIEDINQAIKLAPNDYIGNYFLSSRIHCKVNDFTRAISDISIVRQADPTNKLYIEQEIEIQKAKAAFTSNAMPTSQKLYQRFSKFVNHDNSN